ncbi:MAG: nitroreductase family deazaflavin-dependent oxidoreductase [Anaerolineae bacterium]|nr:nitroreductase family deazaflavin-dependent oxidoreductase [Anaerolineae bacterium]
MSEMQITVPNWTPPKWMNASMKFMLKTPGLQAVVGKKIALITFTGSKSGKTYTTPVTYAREGNTVIMLTKRFRAWWKNFATRPDVTLRLAGKTYTGRATAHIDDEAELSTLIAFLRQNSQDAKAYGITLGPDGALSEADARVLLPQLVIVRVALNA